TECQIGGARAIVEGGLQILEGQRVVEDADVTLAKARGWPSAARAERGAGNQRAEHSTAADDSATGDRALAQKAQTRIASEPIDGLVTSLANCTVYIYLLQINRMTHGC